MGKLFPTLSELRRIHGDMMALTERASKVTGIPLVEECDTEAIEQILGH